MQGLRYGAVAAGLLMAASLALADDMERSTGSPQRPAYTGQREMGTGQTGGKVAEHAVRPMGEHQMTGTVTKIDKSDGDVTVDAQGRELELHFPPSALTNIDKGDQVTVTLAIREAGASRTGTGTSGSRTGVRSEGAGDAPAGRPYQPPAD
jgi:hypothetical protein